MWKAREEEESERGREREDETRRMHLRRERNERIRRAGLFVDVSNSSVFSRLTRSISRSEVVRQNGR